MTMWVRAHSNSRLFLSKPFGSHLEASGARWRPYGGRSFHMHPDACVLASIWKCLLEGIGTAFCKPFGSHVHTGDLGDIVGGIASRLEAIQRPFLESTSRCMCFGKYVEAIGCYVDAIRRNWGQSAGLFGLLTARRWRGRPRGGIRLSPPPPCARRPSASRVPPRGAALRIFHRSMPCADTFQSGDSVLGELSLPCESRHV